MFIFNSGNPITTNGAHTFAPSSVGAAHGPEAVEYMLTVQVTAGTADLSLTQRGVDFTGLSSQAITTAGIRKVVVISRDASVTLTIANASTFSGTAYLERIGTRVHGS